MARKIKVTWLSSFDELVHNDEDGYRVRITVECSEEFNDNNVFAYRELPLNPTTGEKAGFFSHVASPTDLEEMPSDAPRLGEIPEWFRLDYVDIIVRSTEEAETFITDVTSDICRLKNSLDRLDIITPTGEDTCGDDIECGSSSSSSSSSASLSSMSSESIAAFSRCCTGTTELSIGFGQEWISIRAGAGSPIGSSDSLDSLGRSRSRVELLCGLVSQQLLIQGYKCFEDIPDDAIIDGIEATLELRWDREVASGSSSSSSSSSASLAAFEGPIMTYFRLYNADLGPVGDDKATDLPINGPDWQIYTFGSPTDTWNANLTGKDLKRGAFGIMLIVNLPDTIQFAAVEVDGVELCAYWRS